MPPSAIVRRVTAAVWGRRYGLSLAVILLAGGLVTAWLVYDQASRNERDRAGALFGVELAHVAASVERELAAIGEELHEVAGFVAHRPGLEAQEFLEYARDEIANHGALLACEWVPRVPGTQRDEHERRQRAAVRDDYRIRALTDGHLEESPARDDYYPVAYAEPLEPNAPVLGLDLASEPVRRAALLEAARTGRIVVTPPLQLVQAPGVGGALLAIKAVYEHPRAASHRPAVVSNASPGEVRGFVLFVVDAGRLLGALGIEGDASARPSFRLSDTSTGRATIVSSPGWQPQPARQSTWSREIGAAGARWTLEARPSAAFIAQHASHQPATVGVLTFLLFEAVGALLLSVNSLGHGRIERRQSRIVRAVINQLGEGVVVADPDGKFVLFNDQAERMLGLGLLQVSLGEWSSTYGCYRSEALEPYPPEDLPLARGLRGETSQDEEVYIRNPNVPGGLWISINGAPVTGERGELVGSAATFRDITSRRRMEADLRASLAEFEQLRGAINQAVIVSITDAEGRILTCNDKFCEVTGYSREELIGNWHRLVRSGYHPDSFFAGMWQTITSGGVWRGEVCNRSKDDRLYWVDMTVVPLFDGQDRPARYLAIETDITERVRQQETVRRLSSAIEQTADAVFITDRQGVIEYVNRGFEAATGYAAAEVLGRTPRVLKSGRHDARHYEQLWKTILGGDVWRSTTVNRRKTGEEYHAEQTITPLKQPDGQVTHFVSVVKDVTERIRREEREIEMAYAARVQQRLYPEAPPSALGPFDIAGSVLPAAMTGGDYFDYVPMPNGSVGLAVGDVCGHGLASAFIMAETRAYIRPLAMCETNPGLVLGRLNPLLYHDLQSDRQYVTLCLVRLDPRTGRLVHASAGHPPAIVLAADGSVKATLDATGCPLGLFSGTPYDSSESGPLGPGELLLLLTDGVTEAEAPDGMMFGMDRALDVVRGCRQASATEIVRCLQDAVVRFMGEGVERKDDLTVVVCKAL